MEKNNIRFTRIKNLLAGEIMQQPRIWLMRVIVLMGVLVAGALFVSYVNIGHDYYSSRRACESEYIYFIFMLYVLGIIFTSMSFSDCQNLKGRISLLALPALNIEKYIAKFIIYVPAYILLFIASALLADFIRVIVTCALCPSVADQVHFMFRENVIDTDTLYTLTGFIGLQSFYWLGAILWPRYSAVKTFFAMMVLIIFYNIFSLICYKAIIPANFHLVHFSLDDYKDCILVGLPLAIAVVNYWITYVRLKETDVVQKFL